MTEQSRRWLDDLAAPTIAVERLNQATRDLTVAQARRLGLNTTALWALRLLDVHGPLGATDLARRLDIRPASVTTLIDRLEVAGHIERVRDPRDGRRVTVRARDESYARRVAVFEPVVRALDEVARTLDDDQAAVVCAFLNRITDVVGRHGTPDDQDRTGSGTGG